LQRAGSPGGARESPGMLRSRVVAFATLLLALPPTALAQTTATSAVDPAACAEATGGSSSTPTVAASSSSSSGAVPVSPTDGVVSSSSSGGAGETAVAGAGGVSGESCDTSVATVAQEPEPAPEAEGPGQQQPDEPAGEPQPPTIENPVGVPGAEAPAMGASLPHTGLQVLKLALLGLVLLLVGARLRVIAKRRRRRAKRRAVSAEAGHADRGFAPDDLPYAGPAARAVLPASYEERGFGQDGYREVEDAPVAAWHRAQPGGRVHDEWSFPDPNELAPTGLLPSTAMARRRAREREVERA
jgi:hypothetical protein